MWGRFVARCRRVYGRERPVPVMVALALVIVGVSVFITGGGVSSLAAIGPLFVDAWAVMAVLSGATIVAGFGSASPVYGILLELTGKLLGGVVLTTYALAIWFNTGWWAGQATGTIIMAAGLAFTVRAFQLRAAWGGAVRRGHKKEGGK